MTLEEKIQEQTERLTSLPYGSEQWEAQWRIVDRLKKQLSKRNKAATELLHLRDKMFNRRGGT